MNNIRKYREQYGLSLNQLSKYIGSSANSIRNWEVENQVISYKVARQLANFFCITTDELFNDENGKYKYSEVDKTCHDIPVVVEKVKPKEDNVFLKKKEKKPIKKIKRAKNIDFYLNKINVDDISDYAYGLTKADVCTLLEMIKNYRHEELFRKGIDKKDKVRFNNHLGNKTLVSFEFTNSVFDLAMENFSDVIKHALCVCHYIKYKEAENYTDEQYERFLIAKEYLEVNNSVFLKKILKYKKSEREKARLNSFFFSDTDY